jgi:hypothetical protein
MFSKAIIEEQKKSQFGFFENFWVIIKIANNCNDFRTIINTKHRIKDI